MANTHMIGNTSYFLIKPETTFGVLRTSASANDIVLGLTTNMTFIPNILDRPLHTGKITDTICNSVFASSLAAVSIDGAYSPDYLPFFSSYLQRPVTSSAQTFGTGSISFSIMHLDSLNPTKCRYATGCTVKSITLSGAPKDYIKMKVDFVCKDLTD